MEKKVDSSNNKSNEEEQAQEPETVESEYVPAPSFERARDLYLISLKRIANEEYQLKKISNKKLKKNEIQQNKKTERSIKQSTASYSPKNNSSLKKRLEQLVKAASNENAADGIRNNVSTESRVKLLEFLINLHNRNCKIPEKYITFFVDFFQEHPESVKGKYLKFIVSVTAETNGYNSAIKTTNELCSSLRDTEYHEPLMKYSLWLKKMTLVPQMKKMSMQGKGADEIAREFNMTSADVKSFISGTSSFMFPDEQR